jgi:hypothetical protein
MTTDQSLASPRAERIRHSAAEIAPVLAIVQSEKQPITSQLQGGELVFTSRLRAVDPAQSFIIIEPSTDEAANAALVSRPRCTFFASIRAGTWNSASDPRIERDGKPRSG